MNSDLKTPWIAFKEFLSGVTYAEVAWVVTVIGLMYAFHWIATKQLTNNRHTWKVVLWWFAGVFAWIVLMYLFGWERVAKGGVLSFIFFIFAFFLGGASTYLVTNDKTLFKIVNGVIKLIILFSVVGTVGKQENSSWGYSIVFGALLGLILGMSLLTSFTVLRNDSQVVESDKGTEDKEDEIEEDGVDFSDATGI